MAAAVADPQPPPTSPSPSPSPCTTTKIILERYQQGKLLGRGSFAKVYHARSLTTHKSVAIKVIDKSKTHSSMEPRIVGEVAAMRRLNHPNILKIHEVLATKSKIYLVMELAKGGDLFGKLARRPDHRFPEPLARKYFHQLVSALHYCHQNGVAHRDVKPQNLLLDEEGNIKVSDFGLSAVAESTISAKDGLMLQTSCGTPAFAAPEIVGRTRNGYDGSKADAWSCGVILFVMLTGYLPFDDANLVMMYRKMHKREYRFPSWVSKPARVLIIRLLDPNPKTRMSIDEIAKDSWFKNHGMLYPRSVSLGDMASLEEKKYEKILLSERSNTMADGIDRNGATMNAFELITMSYGLNLSGLFDQDNSERRRRERKFTSRESKRVVVEKVGEVGEILGYEVEKREKYGGGSCCVWLGKGRFVLSVTVSEVAAELVAVEMKVVDGSGVGWDQEEVYWEQLKSGLGDIFVSWHQ